MEFFEWKYTCSPNRRKSWHSIFCGRNIENTFILFFYTNTAVHSNSINVIRNMLLLLQLFLLPTHDNSKNVYLKIPTVYYTVPMTYKTSKNKITLLFITAGGSFLSRQFLFKNNNRVRANFPHVKTFRPSYLEQGS